jgi:hypothetical protein
MSLYISAVNVSHSLLIHEGAFSFSRTSLKYLGFQIPILNHTISHLSFVSQERLDTLLSDRVSYASTKL